MDIDTPLWLFVVLVIASIGLGAWVMWLFVSDDVPWLRYLLSIAEENQRRRIAIRRIKRGEASE
jgi:hypothetical protein